MKYLAVIALAIATVTAVPQAGAIPACLANANLNLLGLLTGDAAACTAATEAIKACPPGEAASLETRLASRCKGGSGTAAKGKTTGKTGKMGKAGKGGL